MFEINLSFLIIQNRFHGGRSQTPYKYWIWAEPHPIVLLQNRCKLNWRTKPGVARIGTQKFAQYESQIIISNLTNSSLIILILGTKILDVKTENKNENKIKIQD